ncbi:Abi family protein [Ochrobactrum sp. SFR4]|uniref:Abi family protein n=1 Tax=Ochrobactrum sp. SFR4 TaxID=2717368 RepID=UPI001C8CBE2C|nr:Abi family protein [Ochrobactrum sp. SFR4]MBX8826949.1 Abi family protein [Ochrobactrum sp. SFR4]
MKFSKPSLSIDDQINRLQHRGMIINDVPKARHYLSHVSYYRLRAYWLPFEFPAENDGDHAFIAGTSFNDVLSLYVFDRQLRLHIMDAIERIEVSFRGAWAHHLAMKYGSHGYLDAAIYGRADYYAKAFASLIDEIGKSKDTFIVHYRAKYDDPPQPPIWMIAEILSLGQLSKWYGNLKHRSDRQAIAKTYGLDEKVMVSLVHHIAYVRNICAHHGRLWNKQFIVTMSVPASPTAIKLAMNATEKRRLYNSLVALGYLIKIAAPDSEWRQNLIALVDSCPLAAPQEMGFPDNWRTLTFWQ